MEGCFLVYTPYGPVKGDMSPAQAESAPKRHRRFALLNTTAAQRRKSRPLSSIGRKQPIRGGDQGRSFARPFKTPGRHVQSKDNNSARPDAPKRNRFFARLNATAASRRKSHPHLYARTENCRSATATRTEDSRDHAKRPGLHMQSKTIPTALMRRSETTASRRQSQLPRFARTVNRTPSFARPCKTPGRRV